MEFSKNLIVRPRYSVTLRMPFLIPPAIAGLYIGIPIGGVWMVGFTIGQLATLLMIGAVVASASLGAGKKAKGTSRDMISNGQLINTCASTEPLPVHYGTHRTGGNRVYTTATGEDNKYLHLIFDIGEGEVEGLDSDIYGDMIWLDDKRLYEYRVWDNDLGDYHYYATAEFFTGSPTQELCTTLQQVTIDAGQTEWKDYKRNTSYLYLRLEKNNDLFANLPLVTLKIKGRKIYDPRTGLTAYSSNNALCALDFLMNERFGGGFPLDSFDIQSIIDSANWCDDSGTFTARNYEFNGGIYERQPLADNTDVLLRNFHAVIIWSETGYKLKVLKYDSAVMTLTEDDIVADSFSHHIPGIPETPNRCIVSYVDAVDNYVSKERTIEDTHAVLEYDQQERDFNLDLRGVTSATYAEKLGAYYVDRNRENETYSFLARRRTQSLEPIDIISLTFARAKLKNKILRVMEPRYIAETKLMALTCLSETSEIYDDYVKGTVHHPFETNLPDFPNEGVIYSQHASLAFYEIASFPDYMEILTISFPSKGGRIAITGTLYYWFQASPDNFGQWASVRLVRGDSVLQEFNFTNTPQNYTVIFNAEETPGAEGTYVYKILAGKNNPTTFDELSNIVLDVKEYSV